MPEEPDEVLVLPVEVEPVDVEPLDDDEVEVPHIFCPTRSPQPQ